MGNPLVNLTNSYRCNFVEDFLQDREFFKRDRLESINPPFRFISNAAKKIKPCFVHQLGFYNALRRCMDKNIEQGVCVIAPVVM